MALDGTTTASTTHTDNDPMYPNGRIYQDNFGNMIGVGRYDDRRGAYILDVSEAGEVAQACPWAAVATGQSLDVIDIVAAAAAREMTACGY